MRVSGSSCKLSKYCLTLSTETIFCSTEHTKYMKSENFTERSMEYVKHIATVLYWMFILNKIITALDKATHAKIRLLISMSRTYIHTDIACEIRNVFMLSFSLSMYSLRTTFYLPNARINIRPLQLSPITLRTLPEFTELNLFTSLFEILNTFYTKYIMNTEITISITIQGN